MYLSFARAVGVGSFPSHANFECSRATTKAKGESQRVILPGAPNFNS
jgi:hypothetical protein